MTNVTINVYLSQNLDGQSRPYNFDPTNIHTREERAYSSKIETDTYRIEDHLITWYCPTKKKSFNAKDSIVYFNPWNDQMSFLCPLHRNYLTLEDCRILDLLLKNRRKRVLRPESFEAWHEVPRAKRNEILAYLEEDGQLFLDSEDEQAECSDSDIIEFVINYPGCSYSDIDYEFDLHPGTARNRCKKIKQLKTRGGQGRAAKITVKDADFRQLSKKRNKKPIASSQTS